LLLLILSQCPKIGAGIKTCQARGKKLTISLGGAAGVYGFVDDAEAKRFAHIVWQTVSCLVAATVA
jgi:chitinase